MRTKLSFLWVYVVINIIIKDIHDLFRPGLLLEMQSGIVNGNTITEELMLIGGILIELPVLMIVLTQFLPYNSNKWLNICVATLSILTLFMNTPKDLDDVFFLITTALGLSTIIVFVLKNKETLNITE